MDELYIESFFHHKKALAPAVLEETRPNLVSFNPLPKTQQQLQSSLWLLQQEVNKRFPQFSPMQKLLKQIEEGFATSNHAQALGALEKLEELMDACIRLD